MRIFKRSTLKRAGILCLLTLLMGAACQNNLKYKEENSQKVASDSLSAQEVLYNEVMEIHDEVMPAMSDIMSLSRQIKAVEDSSATTSETVNHLTSRLENASEGMMNWMRNFNPELEDVSTEEAISYLEEEKLKILSVKAEMETAIEAAQKFVHSRKPLLKEKGNM